MAQPLIAAAHSSQPPPAPPVSVEAARAVLTGVERLTAEGKFVVRLFNPGDTADTVLVRPRAAGARVAVSDARTIVGDVASGALVVQPKALLSLWVGLETVEGR